MEGKLTHAVRGRHQGRDPPDLGRNSAFFPWCRAIPTIPPFVSHWPAPFLSPHRSSATTCRARGRWTTTLLSSRSTRQDEARRSTVGFLVVSFAVLNRPLTNFSFFLFLVLVLVLFLRRRSIRWSGGKRSWKASPRSTRARYVPCGRWCSRLDRVLTARRSPTPPVSAGSAGKLAAGRPGRRHPPHGGKDDVRPAHEGGWFGNVEAGPRRAPRSCFLHIRSLMCLNCATDGQAHVRGTEKAGHAGEVSSAWRSRLEKEIQGVVSQPAHTPLSRLLFLPGSKSRTRSSTFPT